MQELTLVLEIAVIAALLVLTVAVVYLFVLAGVSIAGSTNRDFPPTRRRFLILVPAHDEELGIKRTLDSLQQLEQPDQLEIVVIADNCTDGTESIAREAGFSVLVREDTVRRGKPHALRWALERLDLDSFDALVIVDADTRVDPNMASVLASRFDAGAGAVQLNNELCVEEDTPLSQLQYMANAVENRLFWSGRQRLELPILLRGTGMAIAVAVFKKYPIPIDSLAEDTDYAVELLRNGIRIDFAAESTVRSAAVSSYHQALVQKNRWASGTFDSARRRLWSLVTAGFREKRPRLLELAFSFLLLSRPFLLYLTWGAMLLALFTPADVRILLLAWGAAIGALLTVYILLGILLVDNKRTVLGALVHAPYFLAWMLVIQLRVLIGGSRQDWVRTNRGTEPTRGSMGSTEQAGNLGANCDTTGGGKS